MAFTTSLTQCRPGLGRRRIAVRKLGLTDIVLASLLTYVSCQGRRCAETRRLGIVAS